MGVDVEGRVVGRFEFGDTRYIWQHDDNKRRSRERGSGLGRERESKGQDGAEW